MTNLDNKYNEYPSYLDDIPEPDATYYEQIGGGFDDSNHFEPVIIDTPTPPQKPHAHATKATTPPAYIKKIYPEREKLTAEQILNLANNDLAILAADYGVDWSKLYPLINRRQRVYKNHIAIDKNHKNAVKVWVEFAEKNGYESVAVTFNTLKHGGAAKKWTSYQFLKDSGYLDKKESHATRSAPTAPAKPLTPVKNCLSCGNQFTPTKAHFNECSDCFGYESKLKRYANTKALFNSLPPVQTSEYLDRKQNSLDDIKAAGLDVRQGNDTRGNFIIFPLQNIQGETTGYQSIYDKKFIGYDGEPRDKDFCFEPVKDTSKTKKNGSFAVLGSLDNADKGLYFKEGLATGLTGFIATGKTTIVCLDAGNLEHVLKQFADYSKKYIAADNDLNAKGGNVGIFSALQAAKKYNARVFVPVFKDNSIKVDFNDLVSVHGLSLDDVKKQLSPRDNPNELKFTHENYQALLFKYAPANQLKQAAKDLCFQSAKKITSQAEFRQHARQLQKLFNTRGFTEFKAATGIYHNGLSFLLKDIQKDNFFFDHENIAEKIDITGLSPEQIAAKTAGLKGLIIDNRGMGGNKTETMKHIAAIFKERQNQQTAETVTSNRKLSDFERKEYFLSGGAVNANDWQKLLNNAADYAIWCRLNDKAVREWRKLQPVNYLPAYICHRQGLTASGANRLGLEYYETCGYKPKSLASCVNSIINQKFETIAPAFLAIDEARQNLEHILVGSVTDRLKVFDKQAEWIKTSDLVYLADADFNQAAFDYYTSIATAAGKKVYHLVNRNETKHGKKWRVLSSIDAVIAKAVETLQANQNAKLWLASDSVTQARKIYEVILKHLPAEKIMLVTGENKGDQKQADFLADPDNECLKYQAIIHSPVISSGVSITKIFDFVGAVFTGVIQPNEVLQTTGRVRTAKEVFIGFSCENSSDKPSDLTDFFEGFKQQALKINPDNGNYEFSEFDQLRLKHIAASNKASNNFYQYSLILAQLKGWLVIKEESNDEKLDISTGDIKAIITAEKLAEQPISDREAMTIENKTNPTQQETNALDRYRAVKMTGKPFNDLTLEDMDFFLHDKGLSKVKNFELAKTDKAEYATQKTDLLEHELEKLNTKQSLSSDLIKSYIFSFIVNTLKDKAVTKKEIQTCLDFLHKNHQLCAINKLGNFKTSSTNQRTITNFLEKIGYELDQTGQQGGGERLRIYTLKPHALIAEYAQNRQKLRDSAITDTQTDYDFVRD